MRHSRRRFLAVFAAAASAVSGAAHTRPITRHRFHALGTEAQITLVGRREHAEAALIACRHEVSAIESAFSLYDRDSMLSYLNRHGEVKTNTRFSILLRHALEMAEITGGAFDPTIQPLWQAFATAGNPSHARRLVGWRDLVLTPRSAHFARSDMAASFNGIAQGFAAEQVSDVLAQHGFRDTLVDLGEFATRGAKPSKPWVLGIRAPLTGRIIAQIEPTGGAIATSEPKSMLIEGQPHIVDPLERNGERWSSVTVEAREAWRADALSTAIAASPIQEADSLLVKGGAIRGWLITESGTLYEWASNKAAYA